MLNTQWKSLLTLLMACLLVLSLGSCRAEDRKPQDQTDPPHTEDGISVPQSPDSPGSDGQEDEEDPSIGEPSPDDATAAIEAAIARMSLSEKLGQLVMIGVEGEQIDDSIRAFIEERHIGGVILYGRNLTSVEQSVQLIDALKQANHGNEFPLWIGVDEEGGSVTRLPEAIVPTPSSRDIGALDSPEWTYGIGELIGSKVAAFGMNMNFAPVLDIDSNPDNPVIGARSFGSDAEIVSSLGIKLMQGMKSQHVVPVVKHFPGHGDTDDDSHIDLPIVHHDADRLRSFELQPFAEAIQHEADAVMVAHLLVPAFDDQYPASMSRPIITELLREELGFDGVVVTDDMTMGAIAEHYDFAEAVVRSVLAGSDLILVGHGYDRAEAAVNALEEALLAGEITESRLDESLRRLLTLKTKYELTDEEVRQVDVGALNERTEDALTFMNG